MVNRNNWSAIAKECLMSHAETMYWSSRRMYDELPPKEVEKILPSLTPEYRQLFKELPYKRERVRRDIGNENLSDLLLRKLRGGVRCFREHGLLYTIGRVFYKVKNLLKKILRIKK